ncbi:hypothetical protein ACQJBY_040469 [Aegilops geniculata]
MNSFLFADPRKEEEDGAPAAPPLPPPVAAKEQEEELPAPAPAGRTPPPLPLPLAGKEQEEELPAPAPTIAVTMYDISRDMFLHLSLPKTPPAELAVINLPADATRAQIQRAAEILLEPYMFGGGGGRDPYDTSSDDETPFTDDDSDDYVVGGGGPAPTPWRPEDFDFLMAGIIPIYESEAGQDHNQINIRKVKRRLAGKELEEEFKAASEFVQACSLGVPDGLYLRFYGLHKVATEGPCTAPPPSPGKLKPHNEWNAWNNLGGMSTEEAMNEYITTARQFYPGWAHAYDTRMEDEETSASAAGSKGPGPASKTNELELGEIHVSAREGEMEDLKKHLESGVEINARDSRKRTPLHWAVDRGHLGAVELLVLSNADVNAQDDEGQTPLHYAVRREREDIAQLLVGQHADLQIKDGDGNTAHDLCSLAWPFLKPGN